MLTKTDVLQVVETSSIWLQDDIHMYFFSFKILI